MTSRIPHRAETLPPLLGPSPAEVRDAIRNSLSSPPALPDESPLTVQLRRLETSVQRYDQLSMTESLATLQATLIQDGQRRLALVPKGSNIVTIICNADIKDLNDNLLGMEETDSFIKDRQHIIAETLRNYGVIHADNHIASRHRNDTFFLDATQCKEALRPASSLTESSIPPPLTISQFPPRTEGKVTVLDAVIKSIEKNIQESLLRHVQAKLAVIEKRLLAQGVDQESWSTRNEQDSLNVTQLKKTRGYILRWLKDEKYKTVILSFGISEAIQTAPNTSVAMQERLIADTETLAGAKMREARTLDARKHGVSEHRERKGSEFDLAAMVVDMLYAQEQIEDIDDEVRKLYFEPIFSAQVTKWKLKKHIVTAIRKKRLEQLVPDEAVRTIIMGFYNKLNRFDVIRPWPDVHAWGEHIAELQKALDSNDLEITRKAVLTHYKPTEDMTEMEFHARACRHKRGYYLCFDDIGMGNKNMESFQNTFWNILEKLAVQSIELPRNYFELKDYLAANPAICEQIKAIVKAEMIKSGADVTTEYYRKIALIRTALKHFYQAIGVAEPIITSSHRGDEYFAFIPLPETPGWDIGKPVHKSKDAFLRLLANIQKQVGMRCAVAYKDLDAGRQSSDIDDFDPLLCEHQACLTTLEQGIEHVKEWEALQALTETDTASGYGFAAVQGNNHAISTILFAHDEIVVAKQIAISSLMQDAAHVRPELPLAQKVMTLLKGKKIDDIRSTP